MSIGELARPEILRLEPYSTASPRRDAIRLHANEASWPGTVSANRYPEIRPVALGERLAEWYGVSPSNMLVTRGSSEAIDLLIRSFCISGHDHVLLMPPAFGMYRLYADIHGAGIVKVPLDADRRK